MQYNSIVYIVSEALPGRSVLYITDDATPLKEAVRHPPLTSPVGDGEH